MGDFLFAAIAIGLLCFILIMRFRRHAPLEYHEDLPSIPLRIPLEEFEIFSLSIAQNKYYFVGEMQSNTQFRLQFIPPGTVHKGWIQLRGLIANEKVFYEVKGQPIYQSEEFERERLVNKLRELCSPEPGTAQEAE